MKRKTFVKVGKKSRKWQVSPLSESSKTIRTMASLKILLCQLWRYIKLHSSSNFMVSFSILVRRQLHEKPHFWKVNQWRDWLLYSTSLTLRKENKRPPLTVLATEVILETQFRCVFLKDISDLDKNVSWKPNVLLVSRGSPRLVVYLEKIKS